MRRLFIIRKDLNLHPGKLAAMVGHCAECYWMNLLTHGYVRDNEVTPEELRPAKTVSVEIPKEIWDGYINDIFTKTICEAKNLNHLMKVVEVANDLGLTEGTDYGFIDDVCNSLRCPMDGWVHAKNRPKKGKIFRCMKCGYVDDDDEVAAFNNRAHLEGLPDCSHVLVFTWKLHKKSGFYWTNEGFFDEKGNPISEVGSLQSPIGQN